MSDARPFLAFAQIGDLHVSDRDPGHIENLHRIVAPIGDTRDALSAGLGAREGRSHVGLQLGPNRNGRTW